MIKKKIKLLDYVFNEISDYTVKFYLSKLQDKINELAEEVNKGGK